MRLSPRLGALILAATAALATPAAAQAGGLGETAVDCPAQTSDTAFAQWGDPLQYVLVPGGDAESTSGWTLSGDAAKAPGNEPYDITGSGESQMRIGAGGSATTPVQCAGIDHPTLRLLARSRGYAAGLKVEALATLADGSSTAIPLGTIAPSTQWTPTAPYAIVGNLLPLLSGDRTPVRFRFTPLGATGSWSIDDVHVDPWRGGGG